MILSLQPPFRPTLGSFLADPLHPSRLAGRVAAPVGEASVGLPPSQPPEAPRGCSQDWRTAHSDGLRTPDPLFHASGCSAPEDPGFPLGGLQLC